MKGKAGYLKSHYQKPTEEEKLALCKRWQVSGLSQKAFCEQYGVAKSSLYKWHKKYCLNAESTLPNFARLNTVPECEWGSKSATIWGQIKY
jgi:transposase-like protein